MLRLFLRDESANFAILMALLMLPVFGCAALALDYTRALRVHNKLQEAADAAVLAAATESTRLLQNGIPTLRSAWMGKVFGRRIFEASTQKIPETTKDQLHLTVTIESGRVSAAAIWKGQLDTTLLKAIKKDALRLDVRAQANVGLPEYAEVHFVIDNSASMGIGASRSDIDIMANEISCAFACHVSHLGVPPESPEIVRAEGAKLRIDVAREAVGGAIAYLEDSSRDKTFSYAVHTMSNTVKTVLAPTTDLRDVETALASIDLTSEVGQMGTNFHVSIPSLADIVGPSGSGTSQSNRRKIVVIVTDGTESDKMYNPDVSDSPLISGFTLDPDFVRNSEHLDNVSTSQSFNGDLCEELKSETYGITVMTMHVIPIKAHRGIRSTHTRFNYIEDTLLPLMAENMKECASDPAFARSATSPEDIHAALRSLGQQIATGKLRLSN